jgi:predicted MPP superfamily phosphohydrolase
MSPFSWITVVGFSITFVAAWRRSRAFAVFVGVLVGIYAAVANALSHEVGALLPVFSVLHAIVFVNFVALTRPRMRPFWYRVVVSWPASFFAAGTLLGIPWAVALGLGFHVPAPWVPYVLAAVGMVQSLRTKRETIDLSLADRSSPADRAGDVVPTKRGDRLTESPIRIVQISDPHIGPFMSVERLKSICERAVEQDPDLVLLTGDYLTMESNPEPSLLREALSPLKKLEGRVFACHGNHDLEAPRTVAHAMEANRIPLLLGESRVVDTRGGKVQIVGTDFTFRGTKEYLARVCEENPRIPGVVRVILLHNPGAFRDLPEGEADLVLSGHTHGGQLGLVSLGLSWTFLKLGGNKMPDHGYWGRGHDRLWVHRGTAHYGFPIRLGVPAEESVLRIHPA